MQKVKGKKILISIILLFVTVVVILVTRTDSVCETDYGWYNSACSFNQEERNVFLRWFGSGVKTSEDSAYNTFTLYPDGRYNPYTIELARMWQEKGLVGLEILDEYQAEEVLTYEVFSELRPDTQQAIEEILYGGFSIVGEPDGEIQWDALRFQNAINHINPGFPNT